MGTGRLSRRTAAVAVMLAGMPGAAQAAVKVCQPTVVVGPFEAATEAEGKRKALEAWTREATKHGQPFAGWHIAVNKELKCLPGAGGSVRCAARGEPCRIQQTPPKRPGPRNRPIET